ncbi:MAG TPA: carboxymuconolactone decarboxylase family protein [Acidimicrobiales bacterium]|nr:carboxymuconolactone decarboxylase family protein [Acidimicrobiales bacterium]
MARIRTVDPEDFAPALADAVGHPTNEHRVALGSLPGWAVRPELAVAFVAFQQRVEQAAVLPTRLRELVRLRIAFHNRCRSCMATRSGAAIADGMTDGAVCSLERPEEADDLTDAEKAALAYADLVATDHLAVGDEHFERLRRWFDDAEIVELGVHIGVCVGFGRIAATWDLVDHLPDAFRAADAAPWSPGVTIR